MNQTVLGKEIPVFSTIDSSRQNPSDHLPCSRRLQEIFGFTLCGLHFILSLVLGISLALTGCHKKPAPNPKVPLGAKSSGGMYAMIETDKGTIEIELFDRESPKTVENFRLLAEYGYYNGLTFHRIIKGFMIQGGDPLGDGSGGESAWGGTFEDELDPAAPLYQRGYRRGMVVMANAGPNTNGSQFFIMHQDYPLPPRYVIFGAVTKGMDVVDALADTSTIQGADGNQSKPLTPVYIKRATIHP
jgi:cyclophilin family peptidyl-prolyl cis-trans isomerase